MTIIINSFFYLVCTIHLQRVISGVVQFVPERDDHTKGMMSEKSKKGLNEIGRIVSF